MTNDLPITAENKKGPGAKQLALALLKSVVFFILAIYACDPFIYLIYPYFPSPFTQFFGYLLWSLFLLWIFSRFIEKRTMADYGLGAKSIWAAVLEFYDGSLIGSLMVTTVTLILAVLGCYQALAIMPDYQFLAIVPGLLAAALFEEVVFRGYVLQTIERASTTKMAVIVSSLLFGAAHLSNFHANEPLLTRLSSVTSLGLDAGLLFAAAYLYTRRLWLPAGLHAFWNIFEGPVFGTPVSGLHLGPPLILSSLSGPEVLTGGVFGPEASIVELVVCLTLAWVIWQKGKIRNAS
ncbi:type II CAAX endopeptidase family protein [soil metagenome]